MTSAKDWIALVFCLARENERDQISSAFSRLTAGELDTLLRFSAFQGISPVIYHRTVKNHYEELLPAYFLAALREVYLENAARNLYVEKQISAILDALQTHQIPVILLKGVYFFHTIYNNPAARMMTDLDLLVREEHIPRVLKIFNTLGYKMLQNRWEGPGHHLPPFFQPGSPFPVEVHWELTTPNRTIPLPAQFLWENARQRDYSGRAYFELSPTITLFYICQHAAYQHIFANAPRALFDCDALIRFYSDNLDWEQFWQLAEAHQCLEGVAGILKLAGDLLATPTPQKVNAKIQEMAIPEDILDRVYDCMFSGEELPDTPPQGFLRGLRWWLTKTGKFFSSVGRMNIGRPAGHSTSQGRPGFSLKRLHYLLKDNVLAAVNQLSLDQSQEKIKTNRILRGWLKIS